MDETRVDMNAPVADNAKQPWQFSLRSLLLLVTALSALFGLAAFNIWLFVWLIGAALYTAFGIALIRKLSPMHVGSMVAAAAGISALSFSFNIVMSLGGGITGVDRVVFHVGCGLLTLIGAGFVVASLVGLKRDWIYWQKWPAQGQRKAVLLKFIRRLCWIALSIPLLLIAAIVVALIHDLVVISAISPAAETETLSQFADEMPPPVHLAMVVNGDKTFIVWVNERPDTIASLRGSPVAVFDGRGKLLDYRHETGSDRWQYDRLLESAWRSPAITVGQAKANVAKE